MEILTPQQKKAFHFIRERIETEQIAPTLRELCSYMGYKAIGSAQDVIAALRRKGLLAPQDRQAARRLLMTEKGQAFDRSEEEEKSGFLIPCLGSVPAGNPLEAIDHKVGTIPVFLDWLPKPRPRPAQLFALRATGDSMIGAGIFNEDWLIIKSQEEAENGAIVVARIQGEATVKRLIHDSKHGYGLKPENPAYNTLWASRSPFKIVGKVIALHRTY